MSETAKKKRGWKRVALEIGVVVLIFAGVRAWQQRDVAEGPAPALEASAIDGTPISLARDGEAPTLVYFWATWCGVCRAEQGTIDGLAGDHRVLSVSSQSGGDAEVAAYVRRHDLGFPVIADPSGALARRWGVSAFPTAFVVGSDGSIRHVEVGYTTSVGLRIRLWLAGLV